MRYTFRAFVTADKPKGLVGVTINGALLAAASVTVGGYAAAEYNFGFTAKAGDVVYVWMYSPAAPGSVTIDDATLTLYDGAP